MYVYIYAYVCNTYILSSREEEVVGLRASREGSLEELEGGDFGMNGRRKERKKVM